MDNDRLVPPLRCDLELEMVEGQYRLRDPMFGRLIKIDRRGAEIARLLDREQSFYELLSRVGLQGKAIEPRALEQVLAAFDGLGLLETASTENAAAEHIRMLDELDNRLDQVPLIIPDDLSFTCEACGSCCLGANIGPVTDDVTAALSGEKYRELLRSYRKTRGLFFSMVPADEKEEILLCETSNGACIFLDSDGLCGIHRRFGPELKPRVCRLFPYQFVMTPKGIAVGLQLECRNILRASSGRPLTEQASDIRTALKLAYDIPVVRPFVSIDGTVTTPYESYCEIENKACRAIEDCKGGGFDLVLASNMVVLDHCSTTNSPTSKGLSTGELLHAFYSMLQDLGDSLVRLKKEHRAEGGGVKLRTDNLDMVLEALSDLPLFANVVLSSDEDAEGRRLASIFLRNAWRSKDFLLPPDLVTAHALYGLRWLLVKAIAVSRARQVHRRIPDVRDIVDAWVVVHMLMRNKRVIKVIAEKRPEIIEIFGYRLDALISQRDALVDHERRTEFHLF